MGRGLLIIVSGLFIVYGIIQNSLNQRQKSITGYSANYATETKSEAIANAMADLAFAEIEPNSPNAGEYDGIKIMGGTGTVEIQPNVPVPDNPFIRYKIITATGTFNGNTTEVVVTTSRRPFSRYSYFTVREPTIWFVTGDILTGPVHTNGTIHIDGDPVFNGPVTAQDCEGCAREGSEEYENEFPQGADLNAEEIPFPTEIPELADAAADGGLKFDEKIKVEFFNDELTNEGKVNISTQTQTEVCREWDWHDGEKYCDRWDTVNSWSSPTTYTLSDYNGIISSSEDIDVQGIINGDVTLHSQKDIRITGDITYLDNPQENPHSNDFLGIVSEEQTIVDDNAHEANGSNDLTIHASIMALADDDSFTVEDYNDGEERGQLNILGGLIQYKRGPVGLVDGSGYLKNYTYDQRFLSRSPRGFPRSDIYDFVSWRTSY